MKHLFITAAALALCTGAYAQGNNTGMGGCDGDVQSIAERVTKLEKKNDMFNLYLNYSASYKIENDSRDGKWESAFANKQLRLEIAGNLTDKIFYRLRHRLNRENDAKSLDNFAKATDIMMVGYNFNDKLTLTGGKMCQVWGGYEYDENPMFIYQYSDFLDNTRCFNTGVALSYKPVPTHEFALGVSDADNEKIEDEFGSAATVYTGAKDEAPVGIGKPNHQLTYILNWNGSMFDGILTTRWAWGMQTQGHKKYSRLLTLGQRLNLKKLQWYFDYMGAYEDVDRLGIATAELAGAFEGITPTRLGKIHYDSFITKMNWQFAPSWNLMLKGTYETASLAKSETYKNYRKSFGYMGSLEYYPAKKQDFRVFLAYVGRKYDYSDKSKLTDYNTNRIELGFMYRIKAF